MLSLASKNCSTFLFRLRVVVCTESLIAASPCLESDSHLDWHLAASTLTQNIIAIGSKLPSCETSTTAAPTPTPCTFIALPEADPTSLPSPHRVGVASAEREQCTARLRDSQHGSHRSMSMYQTPSQGQGVEAIVQTSSTHSVMNVGLVERPIPSALLSKPSTMAAPHITILPATAARPVSITMLTFLTTSR